MKVAVKLDFRASNNEAEYESVVLGMKTAREAEATRIIIYLDSQLVIQLVKGSYEVREGRMKEYLNIIQDLSENFTDWSVEQIPRDENAEADVLAKMASSLIGKGGGEVIQSAQLVSFLETSPTIVPKNSWRTHFLDYLLMNKLPEDPQQAQRIKRQGHRFSIINGELYRRSFQGPLLKCLSGE
ncbi:uncharacterized protein LOC142556404 [Primulina tabacum]|uniref:uncharacterized protein LOC142556404 n=1 Tax=Primulina tabacum TaxID=48773 RepID=UPI003F59C933